MKYEEPNMEVMELKIQDIVHTSVTEGDDDWDGGWQ